MITLYHQTKIPISFWCRRGLNPRSLIQPSETLLVELTGTHKNYNNTYIEDSKYWNILLLPFSLFNQNQSFKDNSNSIKPIHTYIHMNVKNSKNENNNLQKPYLIQSLFFFFFFKIVRSLVLFPFMFHQNFSNWPKYLLYMLTLNLIRNFTCLLFWRHSKNQIIPKKNYLYYNIGLWIPNQIWLYNFF